MHIYSRKMIVAAAALTTCLVAVPAAADVKAGVDAWEAGNYETAVTEWRSLADKGDADAQFNMGQAYRLGRGVPTDLTIAKTWFEKAAAQGHELAQANLGLILYESGKRSEAMTWIRKAAARGDARAQYVLGVELTNGDLIPKDWPRAYALMSAASAEGIPPAAKALTQMDQFIPEPDRKKGLQLASSMSKGKVQTAEAPKTAPAPVAKPVPAKPVASVPVVMAQAEPKPMPAPVAVAVKPEPKPAPVAVAAKTEPKPAPAAIVAKAEPKPVAVAAKSAPKADPAPVKLAKAESKPATAPKEAPKRWEMPTVAAWNGTKATPTVKTASASPRATSPGSKSEAAAVQTAKLSTPTVRSTASLASPGGRWRVQLGAFPSPQAARSQWTVLSKKMPALSGMQPSYEPYQAFTRLRVGPLAGKAEANKLCAAAKASGQDCFPVAP